MFSLRKFLKIRCFNDFFFNNILRIDQHYSYHTLSINFMSCNKEKYEHVAICCFHSRRFTFFGLNVFSCSSRSLLNGHSLSNSSMSIGSLSFPRCFLVDIVGMQSGGINVCATKDFIKEPGEM